MWCLFYYFRGNSKYHYYGIRIKPDSPLNTYPQEDSPSVAMRQPTTSSRYTHTLYDECPYLSENKQSSTYYCQMISTLWLYCLIVCDDNLFY